MAQTASHIHKAVIYFFNLNFNAEWNWNLTLNRRTIAQRIARLFRLIIFDYTPPEDCVWQFRQTTHRVTSAQYPIELESVVSLNEPLGQLCVRVGQRLTGCWVVGFKSRPAQRLNPPHHSWNTQSVAWLDVFSWRANENAVNKSASNFTSMFPETVQTWPWKFFRKWGVAVLTWPTKFLGVKCYCSNTVKDMDFKFHKHFSRASEDRSPLKFYRKRGLARVTWRDPQFLGVKC